MRVIAVLLSIAMPLSSASAQQARYLSASEILRSYTDRTMMWRVVKNPAEQAAIVHYRSGNQIEIMYDGQVTPNTFEFDNDGTAICWRDRTVCRSFVDDGRGRVFVVNPDQPDEWLDEVTDLTNDRDGTLFQRIARTERDTGSNPSAEAALKPAPAPSPPPKAQTDYRPYVAAAVAGGLLLWWLSRHQSDGGGSYDGGEHADPNRWTQDDYTRWSVDRTNENLQRQKQQ